jgi:hypothetical protein
MPTIEHSNWKVTYHWSRSSGLKLGRCDFDSTRVLHDASVPFLFVNYPGTEIGPFTDELKSRDRDVEVREIMQGFDLTVTYDWYGADYEYDHVWRFHDDGHFGASIVIHGPGEELEGRHTYHVPFRYDLDVSGTGGDSFQRWLSTAPYLGYWVDVATEGRLVALPPGSVEYDWQVVDKATGRRAMIRAGASDSAELWVLAYSALESWSTWGAEGTEPPGSSGTVPALYSNNQSVQNTNIVLWYIAHVSSRDLVASCGPSFMLVDFGESPRRPSTPHPHPHG